MVKGMYSRIIWNLQFSGWSQDLQYIHALLMDPEFGFMENLMPQMTEKLSQMIKLYKGEPGTTTLTESMKGTYKAYFIHDTTQEIKELEQHGTCTIVYRQSVTGTHIISSTWAFKVKHLPDGLFQKFKAMFCTRDDRKVEGVYYFEKHPSVFS